MALFCRPLRMVTLHFHVDCQQRGRVRALPQIQFATMNTVNASTSLELWSALTQVEEVIVKVNLDIGEARDNLLAAKVDQAHYDNTNHGLEVVYNVGDCIMLSTSHRHNKYRKRGNKRAAKIFLWWDGPYTVTWAHPETSNYTPDMNSHDSLYPTYHASELKWHIPNDLSLFLNHGHPQPRPILTANGLKEHRIESIIDSWKRGHGHQFLVRWFGFGPDDDKWLLYSMVKDCEALDDWYTKGEMVLRMLQASK